MESLHDLEILITSGHRLIVLETEREGCFIDGFTRIADRSNRAYFQWTATQGLLRLAPGYRAQTLNKEINQLFAQIHSTESPSVYVLVDFHHHIDDPMSIRHLKDVFRLSPQHCIVLLAQQIELPQELDSLSTRYKLPLPSQAQLKTMVNELAAQYLNETNHRLRADDKLVLNQLLDNLCGLSFTDAQRMARHAIFDDGIINFADIEAVRCGKFELLNRSNTLTMELDFAVFEDLAGMQNLRKWLAVREPVFKGTLDLPGGDVPKGCLLLGVQGCGKSLAAKAVAGSWGVPLLRLDFGTLYNRFYGQTEENLRAALETAEKMQPCVLWLDEIEKGLSAVSGNDDVSKRMLATFLTWLAENKAAVFVVATANDVSALPPELMRKGRFDEVFFVDLPNRLVRESILMLHLNRRNISTDGWDLDHLVSRTEGFSGAELEQLVVSAVYEYAAQKQVSETKGISLNVAMLEKMAEKTRPLSVLMSERVASLRSWASQRTVAA